MNKNFKKTKALKITGIFIAALLLSGVIGAMRSISLNIDTIDPIQDIQPSDRLLVFAPHCDDEVIGPGGLLMSALKQGAPVKVVLVTNGDNNFFSTEVEFRTPYPTAREFIEAGELRQQESLQALRHIGVAKKDVVFLGFPDRGIKSLYKNNWSVHKPYKSRATNGSKAPYKLIYEPGVIYTGENLSRNIKEIIRSFSPTVIAAPHLNDRHPDHKYSAKFIMKALDEIYGGTGAGEKPVLLTYLVHYPHFPRPRGMHPDTYILPPFAATFDMQWFKLSLSKNDQKRKREALGLYKSQLKVPRQKSLVRSFARKNELFERVDDFKSGSKD